MAVFARSGPFCFETGYGGRVVRAPRPKGVDGAWAPDSCLPGSGAPAPGAQREASGRPSAGRRGGEGEGPLDGGGIGLGCVKEEPNAASLLALAGSGARRPPFPRAGPGLLWGRLRGTWARSRTIVAKLCVWCCSFPLYMALVLFPNTRDSGDLSVSQ